VSTNGLIRDVALGSVAGAVTTFVMDKVSTWEMSGNRAYVYIAV
jgi:hypothetical protein